MLVATPVPLRNNPGPFICRLRGTYAPSLPGSRTPHGVSQRSWGRDRLRRSCPLAHGDQPARRSILPPLLRPSEVHLSRTRLRVTPLSPDGESNPCISGCPAAYVDGWPGPASDLVVGVVYRPHGADTPNQGSAAAQRPGGSLPTSSSSGLPVGVSDHCVVRALRTLLAATVPGCPERTAVQVCRAVQIPASSSSTMTCRESC
jgi:hypothetical protein